MKKIKDYIKDRTNDVTKSVRIKVFFMMTISIMVIILILIFVNSFIIESYYLYYKKENLLGTYTKINKYLSSDIASVDAELELEKIAINNNFNILITDNNNISIYNSNKDFKQYMLNLDKIDKSKLLYYLKGTEPTYNYSNKDLESVFKQDNEIVNEDIKINEEENNDIIESEE